MKSAMQELIEAINLITKTYKRGLSTEEILDMCENQLDKEKEQIIDAYNQNLTGFDKLEQEEIGLNWAEDYYNQTYNQNK
jgi:hypothetical protein